MEEVKGVEELKQTLNILKKALITEREERKENSKTIDSLKLRLLMVEETIQKKVSLIQNEIISKHLNERCLIDEEVQKAEERLKSLGKNKAAQPKATATSRSILALEQQNEKLMEEYNTLQKENNDDEAKITKLKQ